MNEVHVFLAVYEFGDDPQLVTDLLGITPTKAWAPGTLMPGKAGERGARWKHGRWELISPAGRQANVQDQLLALLPMLESRAEAIVAVSRRFEVELGCAGYYYEANPEGLHLDVALLRRLAALGLDFDFDIYCLSTNDDE